MMATSGRRRTSARAGPRRSLAASRTKSGRASRRARTAKRSRRPAKATSTAKSIRRPTTARPGRTSPLTPPGSRGFQASRPARTAPGSRRPRMIATSGRSRARPPSLLRALSERKYHPYLPSKHKLKAAASQGAARPADQAAPTTRPATASSCPAPALSGPNLPTGPRSSMPGNNVGRGSGVPVRT